MQSRKRRRDVIVTNEEDMLYKIAGKIQKQLPSASKNKILAAVKNANISEYLHSDASDFIVQKEYESDEDREYTPQYESRVSTSGIYNDDAAYNPQDPLIKQIQSEAPTYLKIRNSCIPHETKKQALRLYEVWSQMESSLERLKLEDKIRKIISVSEEISQDQMERYDAYESKLRDVSVNVNNNTKMKILDLPTTDDIKRHILKLYDDLQLLNPSDSDYHIIRQKFELAMTLPYEKYHVPTLQVTCSSTKSVSTYLEQVYQGLNKSLYGLKSVKERIIEIIHNRCINPKTQSVISLVSKPGRGKNAIFNAVANVIGIPKHNFPLGGLDDASTIKGDKTVYVGSGPSIFLRILQKLGYCNGMVLLDEVDKLQGNKGLKVQDALLHVSDYIQNGEFWDQFLHEYSHDISKLWFWYAMNSTDGLSDAFLSRLDIIEIPDYKPSEIVRIIQIHLLPKVCENIGVNVRYIEINESACKYIISTQQNEIDQQGLRPIEQLLHRVVSKIHMTSTLKLSKSSLKLSYRIPNFKGYPHRITRELLKKIL